MNEEMFTIEQLSLDLDDRMREYKQIAEAVLFTVEGSVGQAEIVKACDCTKQEAAKVLKELKKDYDMKDGAILIRELDGRYEMCSSPRFFEHLVRVVSAPKKPVLSDALMETLAIIACRNPATRVDIEHIRGVKSDFSVNKLIEYGLIEEAGRLDAPGRPMLFRPSEEFYRRFGIAAPKYVPKPGPEMESRISDEAEIEARNVLKAHGEAEG